MYFHEHNFLNLLSLHFILQMIETLGYIDATIGKKCEIEIILNVFINKFVSILENFPKVFPKELPNHMYSHLALI